MRTKAYILLLALLGFAMNTMADKAKLTYYWIAIEKDESGSGSKNVPLRTCDGKDIKKVTRHFAERAHMEGTAQLDNGVLINLSNCLNKCDVKKGKFDCFQILDNKKYTWGMGNRNNDIIPFVSVAHNSLKHGTTVEIKQFKNMVLPGTNGLKHNGCVVVHDEGWSFGGQQFDFFVGREGYYKELDKKLGLTNIDFTVKSCTPGKYPVPSPRKNVRAHHHHE